MADDRGERTEQPTGKRLGDARGKGQVARTPEAGVAMTILGAAAFFAWVGPIWVSTLHGLLPMAAAEFQDGPWSAADAQDFLARVLRSFLWLAAPPILVVATGAVAINVLQVGFLFSGKALEPNWGRLNPIQGFRNLLSPRALVALAKAPLKLALLGVIAYATVRPALPELLLSAGQSPGAILRAAADVVITLLWRLGAAHLGLAALDFGYQYWAHRRGLRMTKQEVKDENRQSEGDPAVKARARSLHRQYAMRRMMEDVARATVVVTNPTHLAVALRYEAGSMRAPRVVAKGARLVAQRIRERARAAGVPVIEQKPLAQALFKAVPVGAEIPPALYRAVAEILARVWALSRRRGEA